MRCRLVTYKGDEYIFLDTVFNVDDPNKVIRGLADKLSNRYVYYLDDTLYMHVKGEVTHTSGFTSDGVEMLIHKKDNKASLIRITSPTGETTGYVTLIKSIDFEKKMCILHDGILFRWNSSI